MSIILFLIYILTLVRENLLLPAIAGPEIFAVTPIFILAIVVNSLNFKKAGIELIILSLVGELFMGAPLGSSLVPLIVTAFVYFALDRFIEMRAGLDSIASFPVILGRSFILLCLSYIYFWFFIFFSSSSGFGILTTSNIYASWSAWNMLLSVGIVVTTFVWSCVFSIIFAYVLKAK